MSIHSPKSKYRVEINYDKPLSGIGSVESYSGDELDNIKAMAMGIAASRKVPFSLRIMENKAKYPEFDWVLVENVRVK